MVVGKCTHGNNSYMPWPIVHCKGFTSFDNALPFRVQENIATARQKFDEGRLLMNQFFTKVRVTCAAAKKVGRTALHGRAWKTSSIPGLNLTHNFNTVAALWSCLSSVGRVLAHSCSGLEV